MEYVRDSNMEVYTSLVQQFNRHEKTLSSIFVRSSAPEDFVQQRIGFADSIEWSEDATASPLALLSSGSFA